jgi:hypothetical protein
VFDNTPAAKDGTLQSGDELVGVNGVSVKGKTKVEVAKMIQASKVRNIEYLLGVSEMITLNFTATFFKVCKSVHHCTFQINHQSDATIFQFTILTFIYSSTCFECSPAHHQEFNDCSNSLWFYLRIMVIAVLCLWLGQSDHEHSTAITMIRR